MIRVVCGRPPVARSDSDVGGTAVRPLAGSLVPLVTRLACHPAPSASSRLVSSRLGCSSSHRPSRAVSGRRLMKPLVRRTVRTFFLAIFDRDDDKRDVDQKTYRLVLCVPSLGRCKFLDLAKMVIIIIIIFT